MPRDETPPAPVYLTTADVARQLIVDPKTVIAEINAGNLPAIRVRHQYRVAEHDLAQYMLANQVPAPRGALQAPNALCGLPLTGTRCCCLSADGAAA